MVPDTRKEHYTYLFHGKCVANNGFTVERNNVILNSKSGDTGRITREPSFWQSLRRGPNRLEKDGVKLISMLASN